MREKVEALKDHTDLRSYGFELFGLGTDLNPIDQYLASLVRFELVDAADQSRFARTGRAANYDALAFRDGQVDRLQSLKRAETL